MYYTRYRFLVAASAATAAVLLVAGLAFGSTAKADPVAADPFAPVKAHITLPFHLINGYLLIEGNVNGFPGKFMFDTGTPFALLLNNHYVPLTKDSFLSKGSATSGQSLTLYTQNVVKSVTICDQAPFIGLTSVPHSDLGFVEEGICARYLGFIGHGFNKSYLFIIDYDSQIIDLYSLSEKHDALKTRLGKDRIVSVLHFTSRDAAVVPEVELSAGKQAIIGRFDTGSQGVLRLTESVKVALEKSGCLSVTKTPYQYGACAPRTICSLGGLRYKNQRLSDVHGLTLEIGDRNELTCGYQFLKNYVTAWNYGSKTITLLTK